MVRSTGTLAAAMIAIGLLLATDAWRQPIGAQPTAAPVDSLEIKEKALRDAIKRQPKDAELQFKLGNLYYDQGRREEAEEAFRESLKLRPDYVEALVNLGVVQNESGSSLAAIEQFDRALRVRPNDVTALCNKGQALYALQRYGEAVDLYKQSIVIDAKSQLAHYLLGIAFADAGMYREAIRDWQRVVEINPSSEAAKTASEGIEVLQSMLREGR